MSHLPSNLGQTSRTHSKLMRLAGNIAAIRRHGGPSEVVVLENASVGKICIVNRLPEEAFVESEPTTSANFLVKTLMYEGSIRTFDS
jgi:hypothetical protein